MRLANWPGPMAATRCLTALGESAEQLLAQLLQFVEGDHPVAVAVAVDDHDLHTSGSSAPARAACGVGSDSLQPHATRRVGDAGGERIARFCRRINGGGRSAGAHHGEIDERRFVPRRRRERDRILRGDSQRDQPPAML